MDQCLPQWSRNKYKLDGTIFLLLFIFLEYFLLKECKISFIGNIHQNTQLNKLKNSSILACNSFKKKDVNLLTKGDYNIWT